jgi:hypothetical protein
VSPGLALGVRQDGSRLGRVDGGIAAAPPGKQLLDFRLRHFEGLRELARQALPPPRAARDVLALRFAGGFPAGLAALVVRVVVRDLPTSDRPPAPRLEEREHPIDLLVSQADVGLCLAVSEPRLPPAPPP